MDISNKALAMFLLAAIVVSLGGTIVSLNKLDSVTTTGYAVDPTGTVNLTVNSTLSITTEDSRGIDFGECTTAAGTTATIDTDVGQDTATRCPTATDSNISVRNDGNVDASVVIESSRVGKFDNGTAPSNELFLESSSGTSRIFYKTVNDSGNSTYSGGCMSGLVDTYAAFTEPAGEYTACTNLTSDATTNSFITDFQIVLPYDAPTGLQTTTITYTATEI